MKKIVYALSLPIFLYLMLAGTSIASEAPPFTQEDLNLLNKLYGLSKNDNDSEDSPSTFPSKFSILIEDLMAIEQKTGKIFNSLEPENVKNITDQFSMESIEEQIESLKKIRSLFKEYFDSRFTVFQRYAKDNAPRMKLNENSNVK